MSIDVVFHELIFPFQTISQNQVILDSLLDLVIPIPLTNALPNPDQNTSQPTQTSISFIQNPSDLPLVPSPDQPDLLPSCSNPFACLVLHYREGIEYDSQNPLRVFNVINTIFLCFLFLFIYKNHILLHI